MSDRIIGEDLEIPLALVALVGLEMGCLEPDLFGTILVSEGRLTGPDKLGWLGIFCLFDLLEYWLAGSS